MYTFCIIMITIASILLILAVLVQAPKSGMAANFGAANQTMGVRQTTDFLLGLDMYKNKKFAAAEPKMQEIAKDKKANAAVKSRIKKMLNIEDEPEEKK